MTVREMLTRMDSMEMSEWMAYYRMEAQREMGAEEPESPDAIVAKLKAMM